MGVGADPLVTCTNADLVFSEMAMADLDAVVEIERQSFEHPWSRGLFESELESDISRTILARGTEGLKGPVAYVCRWLVADEMQILNLAVHVDHRRRGIARRLMEMVLEEGRRTGVAGVTLEVRDGNLEAVKLYESLGFAQVGRRRDYYGTGRDGVLMTLLLDAKAEDDGERT